MATLYNNSKGFGLIKILLLVIATSGVIGVGYYIYSQNSNKTNSSNTLNLNAQSEAEANSVSNTDSATSKIEPYKKVISFKDDGPLTEAQKTGISLKLAEPLSFYHFKNMNIPLKEVTIQKAESQGYTLSYVYAKNPETNKFGFVFDASEVRYWQPMLCDPGGCNPYPESLKKAYPANYKAYEVCQAAKGDKEKQNTLGCDYVQ